MKKRVLNKKGLVLFVSAALIAMSFTGCGGASKSYATTNGKSYDTAMATEAYDGDYGYEYAEEELAAADVESPVEVQDTSRKLITTYNLSVETEEFDGYTKYLENKVTEFGGYIQDLSEYNGSISGRTYETRYSYLTVRIPSAKAKDFLNLVGENANITNQDMNVEDVTLRYVDTKSEKDSYVVEQERLMSLLEQAETMEDILTIEARLSEVRYKINSMESQLRTYDNLVDYTTFNINISEVETYTEPEPESYGARLLKSFTEGLSDTVENLGDFFVGFLWALPGLVVFIVISGGIFLIVFSIVRSANKKAAKRREAQAQAKAAQMQAQMQAMQAAQAPQVAQGQAPQGQQQVGQPVAQGQAPQGQQQAGQPVAQNPGK